MRRRAERRRRGFVSLRMANPWMLLTLGAGLFLAVVAGIGLGNAAVDGIDPVHFRSPEPPSRRFVLDAPPPAPLSQRPPDYSELYGWDEGATALANDCGADCADGRTYTAAIPYFGSREELEAAQRRAREAIDRAYADEVVDVPVPAEAALPEGIVITDIYEDALVDRPLQE